MGMREDFEAWATPRNMMKARNDDGSYVYERTRVQWEAWQASRAALVVEIPHFDDYPSSMDREMQQSLRDVLTDAGVSYK